MGVDALAHFPHQIEPADLLDVPRRLSVACKRFESLPAMRSWHRSGESADCATWSWDDVGDGSDPVTMKALVETYAAESDFWDSPFLRCPLGLHIRIARRHGCIRLCKWGWLLYDIPYQNEAREVCRSIVRALGGREVLYAMDSMFTESRWEDTPDYHTMVQELKDGVGPSAPSLAAAEQLMDTLNQRWGENPEASHKAVEREVRAQFPHGMYFVEPVD